MIQEEAVHSALVRYQRIAFGVGLVAALLAVAGFIADRGTFFRSYLFAYVFWIGLALGCLGVLLLHQLVAGSWGFVIQRFMEAGTRVLPLMAVLFVPLLFGLPAIYPWARPERVAESSVLQHRLGYLNLPFFALRSVVYFAVWIGLGTLLTRWSEREDEERSHDRILTLVYRQRRLSAPGVLLYFLAATFAAVDWVMSLSSEWFSTIYGALVIIGEGLAALAFGVVLAARFAGRAPLKTVATERQFHNLGNLLLAFVMLWAYLAFSQFLIIWAGNLPREIGWYLSRTGRWTGVAIFLIVFHFFVPFFILLSRQAKRTAKVIGSVAGALLVFRVVDVMFLVKPSLPEGGGVHWLDAAVFLAIGGAWVGLFCRNLKRLPLLPAQDPRLVEHLADAGASTSRPRLAGGRGDG